MIGLYLANVVNEAESRGYNFDHSKILCFSSSAKRVIKVSSEQVRYEIQHLPKKLKVRDKSRYNSVLSTKRISVNPIFKSVPGKIENWEKI